MVFILNLLYSFLSFLPFVKTTIVPIESTPWILDISYASILSGTVSRLSNSVNWVSAPILFSYFCLFKWENLFKYSIAFFLTIIANAFFSPFWGNVILTLFPFFSLNHCSNISLSSISSSIIISFGIYSCSI